MTDSLSRKAAKHRAIVQEYCELSARTQLDEADADRIGDILALAEGDALLSLLIDEADHVLNHLFHFVDEAYVAQQQSALKASIDRSWLDQVLLDASARMPGAQGKTLQSYLKDRGLYVGAIDGVVGPETQAAVRDCEDLQQSMQPPEPIHLPDLQEC
ncbi:MAG: peptidoglycan-binding domain-containing protein [Cyanobacteria bacterium P01_A01_bin.105]